MTITQEVLDSVLSRAEDGDLDELREAQPDTLREELRRCEVALGRLSIAFTDLTEKPADVTGE